MPAARSGWANLDIQNAVLIEAYHRERARVQRRDQQRLQTVLDGLVGRYAETFGTADSDAYRQALARRLEVASDPRAERYWQLLGTINGWPAQPTLAPVFDWFTRALRAHPSG